MPRADDGVACPYSVGSSLLISSSRARQNSRYRLSMSVHMAIPLGSIEELIDRLCFRGASCR